MKSCLLIFAVLTFILSACVKGDPDVILKSITFHPDTLFIQAGSSTQLNPVFTPNTFNVIPVEWSSSASASVSVSSSGMLYAVKKDTVFITIKDQHSATKGKCTVIVQ